MNKGNANPRASHTFVLQLRREQDITRARDPLRIILRNPQTGDLHSFAGLEQLANFLAACLSAPSEEP